MKKNQNQFKTYNIEFRGNRSGHVELSRDLVNRPIKESFYGDRLLVRDEFQAENICLVNDRYRHIDREAVADKIIDILELTEGQALVLMIAAHCDTGDIIPMLAEDEEGKGIYLPVEIYELQEMKLVTLYDEAMIVDWNWLAGIIGWYELEEAKEAEEAEEGEESNEEERG